MKRRTRCQVPGIRIPGTYHTGACHYVRKSKKPSHIFKHTKCSLNFRTNWDMIKNPSDEECGETVCFVANAFKCTEPVSDILLKRESLTRCKRGRWARSRQALLAVYVLQQDAVVPDTVHCCCCIMCHTKIEATKMCRVSRSDLQQQQRCSIMHPSGRPHPKIINAGKQKK